MWDQIKSLTDIIKDGTFLDQLNLLLRECKQTSAKDHKAVVGGYPRDIAPLPDRDWIVHVQMV